MTLTNDLGQPIGFPLADWKPCDPPPRTPMTGRTCRLELLDRDKHLSDLYAAFSKDTEGRIWTYLPCGPFDTEADYREWVEGACFNDDPLFHAIIDLQTEKPVGVASYLRIDPKIGSIEVGHINYSPLLQRSIAATEAMYLMMARVFDELGYRRYEWKCDSLNAKSCAAAERYGFTFEGIFRQCTIYKQRNRDTAWYSILDTEWPALKDAFQTWLDPANFDDDGNQKQALSVLTAKALGK
ncbi:MAG: GNAT family N-acetyltransferase [Rhodospirillales bacterium]|nr:GNAT family N-acetyltransferase [Rhodospirillales bacterium]MBO6786730.1 GNAT family N-acetyltransferase [Rhodospirillales bacterium]